MTKNATLSKEISDEPPTQRGMSLPRRYHRFLKTSFYLQCIILLLSLLYFLPSGSWLMLILAQVGLGVVQLSTAYLLVFEKGIKGDTQARWYLLISQVYLIVLLFNSGPGGLLADYDVLVIPMVVVFPCVLGLWFFIISLRGYLKIRKLS